MLGYSISKNSLVLALFAFVTAGLLAGIYSVTKDKIAEQERIAAAKALLEIVPQKRHNNAMLDDTWAIPTELKGALNLKDEALIHIARLDEKPVAVILPAVAPDGYSGDIKLLIGINVRDNSIAGVRALSHKETPGLGDKVDLKKSDWILSFADRSLGKPVLARWKVKKDGGDFDQFTGATITPRAVVRQVKESLEFFEQHKNQILNINMAKADE